MWESMCRCMDHEKATWSVDTHKASSLAGGRESMEGRDVACVEGSLLKHVELFNRIHQHSPHVWVCEEVVSKAMLSHHVSERGRGLVHFMTFWNCLKDMRILGGQKFDR